MRAAWWDRHIVLIWPGAGSLSVVCDGSSWSRPGGYFNDEDERHDHCSIELLRNDGMEPRRTCRRILWPAGFGRPGEKLHFLSVGSAFGWTVHNHICEPNRNGRPFRGRGDRRTLPELLNAMATEPMVPARGPGLAL